jgi:ABC-type multidrug transport system ATPase subunit
VDFQLYLKSTGGHFNFIDNMESLYVDSVLKSYGSLTVLTDIFIECRPGEIVGLIGRNGSGKSTLMKIIFGSIPAQQKFVRINGVHIDSMKQAIRWIRYLPQDHYLPKNIKIHKVIEFYRQVIDIEKFKKNPLVINMMLSSPGQLSAGEKRIVEILLILHSKTKYIILDEPFNGVAPIYKDDIKSLIREASKSKGILLTDHDYRNVIDVSDRLLLLYDGGIKNIKDKNELVYYGYIPD